MPFAESERRQRFAHTMQIVGPTVGFLFTAVGLAAALATTGVSNLDLDTFYAGLNVAMVSTALGLLVRLMAQMLTLAEAALQARLHGLAAPGAPNADTPSAG
jgi:biopolymer transport protein ExbB/TolQ